MSDITERITEGLAKAHKEMLKEKALRNEEIVIADENGNPIRVNARSYFTEDELKRILNIEIVNNKIINLPSL